MQTENSTTTEKRDEQLVPAWVRWTGVIVLAAMAVAINGGANFYGGYLIAVELIGDVGLGYLVGAVLASIPVFQLAAYLSRRFKKASLYLHLVNVLLLVLDISHFVYMSNSAVTTATGDIAQVEREIADIDYQIVTLQKEIEGIAATVTGNNVQSLTAQINAIKNTAVSGGTLWDVSAGCTAGGYRSKCSKIATMQADLDTEIARASNAELVQKRGEVAKLRGMKTEKEGMKQGMKQKSDSAGFLMQWKPEGITEMEFSVYFSAPLAIALEIFLLIPFGLIADMTTPKTPQNRGMKGHELGHEIRAWIGAWMKNHFETQKRAALVKAAAIGKEEVARNAELNQKQAELERQKVELSGDVHAYMKTLSKTEVGALMDKKGCIATEKRKAHARDVVHACLQFYQPGARIPQSGSNAMYERVGDKQKHFRLRVIPALVTLGLANSTDGVASWVSNVDAWDALGKPQAQQKDEPATEARRPVVRGKPQLTSIKGGVA